jgi:hypothetical protein
MANDIEHIAVINGALFCVHSKQTECTDRFDEYIRGNWEVANLQESCCKRTACTRRALASWKSRFIQIVFRTFWANMGADGEQSVRASSRRSSGIPPTSVETMWSPQSATLTIDTQKASINEQFRKRCPCFKISEIRLCLTDLPLKCDRHN